jgi:hypothetical protein
MKHFTIKSHFTCIDEANSINMFLLSSLHLYIYVTVNSYVIKILFFTVTSVRLFCVCARRCAHVCVCVCVLLSLGKK